MSIVGGDIVSWASWGLKVTGRAASELPAGYVEPSEADVRAGVEYGPEGNRYTGTLIVPGTLPTTDLPMKGLPKAIDDLIQKVFDNQLSAGINVSGPAILRRSGGTYDPSTGTMVNTGEAVAEVQIIEKSYSTREVVSSGGAIKLGDLKVMMRGGVTEPAVDDILEWRGQQYTVLDWAPFRMHGFDVLYVLHCRRS